MIRDAAVILTGEMGDPAHFCYLTSPDALAPPSGTPPKPALAKDHALPVVREGYVRWRASTSSDAMGLPNEAGSPPADGHWPQAGTGQKP